MEKGREKGKKIYKNKRIEVRRRRDQRNKYTWNDFVLGFTFRICWREVGSGGKTQKSISESTI